MTKSLAIIHIVVEMEVSMFKLVPVRSIRKADHIGNSEEIFEQFFDDFFNPNMVSKMAEFKSEAASFNVDVIDDGDRYIINAELPGVSKENLSLSYDDKNLTISTKVDATQTDENINYIRRERYSGRYERSFFVENIVPDTICATFENGVLKIVLEKRPLGKISKEIRIK